MTLDNGRARTYAVHTLCMIDTSSFEILGGCCIRNSWRYIRLFQSCRALWWFGSLVGFCSWAFLFSFFHG